MLKTNRTQKCHDQKKLKNSWRNSYRNQINALRQRLAIERSKRQNQSTIKKPAREILKNDYRDVISSETSGITESGKPIYEEISDKPKNNLNNTILRYEVKNYESNNTDTYLNKISEWVK